MQLLTCPCCGYKTYLEENVGSYSICEVCFWEDDPLQSENPAMENGANKVSLIQGQKNFEEFGACEKEMISHVRRPSNNELRDPDWRPF